MNYSKLRGKIREVYGTEEAFARSMGMSPAAMSARLNGKSRWYIGEVMRAITQLDIPENEIGAYFFIQGLPKR